MTYEVQCSSPECSRVMFYAGDLLCPEHSAEDDARVATFYVAVLDRCGPVHFLDDHHECAVVKEPPPRFEHFKGSTLEPTDDERALWERNDDVYDPPSGELRIGGEVVEH